jgi:ATP synthase protein I
MNRLTVSTSNKPPPATASDGSDEADADDFKPLTRQEAQQWRARQPAWSVWRVVGWQVALMVLAALLGGVLTQQWPVAWSVAYGGACIALPTALMAYGLTASPLSRALVAVFPGMARLSLAGVLFWEGVKVLLALVMMWLAPRVVPDLSWLGLVAGLVVVLKAYWLAFWFQNRRAPQSGVF